MTLIVAIKCKDGIVVGSDGAATLGVLGQHTIRQPTTKLQIIAGCIVVGVSGPVGLGQRLTAEVEAAWTAKALSGKKPHEAMVILRQTFWPHIHQEIEIAAAVRNALGPSALDSALSQTIVALPLGNTTHLFQFDPQGAPEEATDNLPFIAIGSGMAIADPFLAFIRRIFWSSQQVPTVADGVFACIWTLEHAIQTNAGGVADPKQIIVLERDAKGKEWTAHQLVESDWEEHEQAIVDAEATLKNFRSALSAGSSNVPEPPLPGDDSA